MTPKDYDLSTTGGRLGHLIDKGELNRSQIARRLDVDPSQITAWIKGRFEPQRPDTIDRIAGAMALTQSERDWLDTGRGETPTRDGTVAPEPVNGLDSILADYFRGVDAGLDQTALFDVAVQKLQQIVPSATRRQAENVLKITLSAHRQAIKPGRHDSKHG